MKKERKVKAPKINVEVGSLQAQIENLENELKKVKEEAEKARLNAWFCGAKAGGLKCS